MKTGYIILYLGHKNYNSILENPIEPLICDTSKDGSGAIVYKTKKEAEVNLALCIKWHPNDMHTIAIVNY